MINRSSYYLQAPVGNRSYVQTRSDIIGQAGALNNIDGWDTTWLGSGTMSLAVATLIAVEQRPRENPKVLVPAYGCPDLVSAIRFAGAEPLYADTLPNESRMDLQLARSIIASRSDVIAIIGVDLFGIPENWDGLKSLAREFGLFLIQDLAQSVQVRELMLKELHGDAVVFSFGRGKPVCCLAGGALLTREEIGSVSRPLIAELKKHCGEISPRMLRTKAVIYDFLLWPFAYAQLARMMGDRLGQTRYKVLAEIWFVSNAIAGLLDSAVAHYWSKYIDVYDDIVSAAESAIGCSTNLSIKILKDSRHSADHGRLSRLPLLVACADLQDRLLDSFRKSGISATTMYSRALPQIVADFDKSDEFVAVPNAQAFADALITLPSHGRLSRYDIQCVSEVLSGARGRVN